MQSLSSEVILENSKLPEGVSISYKAFCKNGVRGTEDNGRKCTNISIGDEVIGPRLGFHVLTSVKQANQKLYLRKRKGLDTLGKMY